MRPVSVFGDLPDHDFPDRTVVVNKAAPKKKACRSHMVSYTINEEYATLSEPFFTGLEDAPFVPSLLPKSGTRTEGKPVLCGQRKGGELSFECMYNFVPQ